MAVPLFDIRKRKLSCNLLGEQVQVGDLLIRDYEKKSVNNNLL